MHAADAAGSAPGIAAEPRFPPAYPTGVLLGCVEVVDVVAVRWPQLGCAALPDACMHST